MRTAASVPDKPSVHPTYARMLCITLRGLGLDVEATLRQAGMPGWATLSTSETLLDQVTINRLISAALSASARPWLGIDVGGGVQASAHGPLGSAVVASANLLQALQTVARFGGVRFGSVQYQLFSQADGVVLTVTELLDLGESRTFVSSMVFATLLKMMEAVVGHRLDGITIDFPFPEPSWRTEIERLCPGSLRFERPCLAFYLANDLLLSPCITADSMAFHVACQQCEQLMHQSTFMPLKLRVVQLLNAAEGTYPSLQEVAKHVHCSERTLIRRLKAEGSSYQALLDDTRFRRAQWYLVYSNLAIEEIANRLGFEDTSNFGRTFRRWSGKLPSAIRHASLTTPGLAPGPAPSEQAPDHAAAGQRPPGSA